MQIHSIKAEAAVRSCSVKMLFSKKFTKFTIKQLCRRPVLKKAAGRWVINERLLHRYFPVSFTKFLKAPILKNSVNGCLLFENKPPAPRRSEKITSIDNMKYLPALVLLYQRIFVFYSSLTFPRDLYWAINFQILSDQTINSPSIDAP